MKTITCCIAAAVPGHLTRIDCHALTVTPVALPADVEVVVRFGHHRTLDGSEYAQRTHECAAAEVIMGPAAVSLMAGLIMVSTFGCINGYVLVGPRMYYAMAKEGLFFKKAAELSPKGVPQWALWVQCAWAIVLCFSGTYGDLLDYATFASLLFYVVTIAGLFILRKREPDTERPYRAFGYPIVPVLYILCALGFCVNLLVNKPDFTVGSLVIVALGAIVFFATGMHRRSAGN